jgi:4-hydroxybenzoate polyprenyltransferase
VAILYPFAKRWTQLPQGILGIAFSWGIPMAWAASTGSLTTIPWIFFSTCLVWIIAYDTLYAMVDKEDDELIGVKSSALLFGERTHFIVGFLQGITILGFCVLGWALDYGSLYLLGILGCVVLFIYQHKLISTKNRENYFKAFLNNNWVGLSLFAGTIMETTNWSIF